jgi:hypothetical protein
MDVAAIVLNDEEPDNKECGGQDEAGRQPDAVSDAIEERPDTRKQEPHRCQKLLDSSPGIRAGILSKASS